MDELYLQHIYIYPIKSLGGISLAEAEVVQTGIRHDRRWMLTDKEGKFLSQRSFPQMALLQVTVEPAGLLIDHKKRLHDPFFIPFDESTGRQMQVTIWDDVCTALEVSHEANEWFSDALGMKVQLVYMPSTTKRLVDSNYATNNEIVSFADGYPLLMIGQASLDDLNQRLETPILMNRFRPNLVFYGGSAYCEDSFTEFQIEDVTFNAVKPCGRCVMTTVNQEDGVKGQEPLKTLASYRTHKNKILFGQNLLQKNSGKIKVGDRLKILSTSNES